MTLFAGAVLFYFMLSGPDSLDPSATAGGLGRAAPELRNTRRTHTVNPVALGLAAPGPIEIDLAAAGHRHGNERPLPGFDGVGIYGKPLSISDFIGKRLVILFFNPSTDQAEVAATAIARIAAFQGKNNFQVVGVAIGASAFKAGEFARKHKFDFPIFDDSQGSISQRLGIRQPVVIYGFDS